MSAGSCEPKLRVSPMPIDTKLLFNHAMLCSRRSVPAPSPAAAFEGLVGPGDSARTAGSQSAFFAAGGESVPCGPCQYVVEQTAAALREATHPRLHHRCRHQTRTPTSQPASSSYFLDIRTVERPFQFPESTVTAKVEAGRRRWYVALPVCLVGVSLCAARYTKKTQMP